METFQKVNRIVSNEKRRIQLQSLKNSPESSSSTSTSASTKKMKAVVFCDNALLKPRLMPKYQPSKKNRNPETFEFDEKSQTFSLNYVSEPKCSGLFSSCSSKKEKLQQTLIVERIKWIHFVPDAVVILSREIGNNPKRMQGELHFDAFFKTSDEEGSYVLQKFIDKSAYTTGEIGKQNVINSKNIEFSKGTRYSNWEVLKQNGRNYDEMEFTKNIFAKCETSNELRVHFFDEMRRVDGQFMPTLVKSRFSSALRTVNKYKLSDKTSA
jgi:hypothetical protein